MAQHEIVRSGGVSIHITSGVSRQFFFAVDNAEAKLPPEEAARNTYEYIGAVLRDLNMILAHDRIFGSLAAYEAVEAARGKALRSAGAEAPPCSYIQGQPVFGEGLAGMLIHAVRPDDGTAVETFSGANGARGRSWLSGGMRYTQLHSVHGEPGSPPRAQAEAMFAAADGMLRARDLSYGDVTRTWLYLSSILDWYGDLNQARDAKYSEFGLMPDLNARDESSEILLPASTGIEGSNRFGSACLMDALALSGTPRPSIRQMANKRQKDAFRYGSSFSRGACIHEPGGIRIEISGTASIDETGKTVHVGDAQAQIERTLDTIAALLASERAALKDIACATVFFKHPGDYALFREIARKRRLEDLPAVYVRADICRDDLLFEMDGTALLESANH